MKRITPTLAALTLGATSLFAQESLVNKPVTDFIEGDTTELESLVEVDGVNNQPVYFSKHNLDAVLVTMPDGDKLFYLTCDKETQQNPFLYRPAGSDSAYTIRDGVLAEKKTFIGLDWSEISPPCND